LRLLALSGCKAVDYSAVSSLANLQYLRLDHSTFADVAPLTSLTNLTHLYLSGCSVNNHQPLSDVYPNLVQSDFTLRIHFRNWGWQEPLRKPGKF
jgi:Leucine-rich repeat (LRR) protein